MKKILIVGGTGGLGNQVSNLLKDKYQVTSIGSNSIDVSNMASCAAFFLDKTYDVVINFAGLNYDSFVHKIDESNINKFKHMIDVNVTGTINLVSTALRQMRRQKYGRIILISSVLADKEVMGTAVYSACKSFIDKFVKNVSSENIKHGITTNSIRLGYFDGGMTYKIPESFIESVKNNIGLGRFGTIEELSNLISFIIETEYITGTNIEINGGV